MINNSKMSALEDVWVQLFVLVLVVSGIFSAHYFLRKNTLPAALPAASPALPGIARETPRVPVRAAQPVVQESVPKVAGRWVVAARRGPDVDCSSLSEALTGAADGDIITLRPGTYSVNLDISKSVTIIGGGVSPDQVVLIVKNQPVTVNSERVVLENLTLSNLNTMASNFGTLIVLGGSLTLRNAKLLSEGDTVRVMGADFNVSDSSLKGGTTLSVSGKSRVKIIRCVLTGEYTAVMAQGGEVDLSLENSRIQDTRGTGLMASKFAWVKMSDMFISGNVTAGVSVYSGAEVTITNSKITDNRECGVLVEDGGRVILEKVRLARNKCGVGFTGPGTLDARNSHFSELSLGAIAVQPGLGNSAVIRGYKNFGLLVPGEKKAAKAAKTAKAARAEKKPDEFEEAEE